jgi:hypothetical protein
MFAKFIFLGSVAALSPFPPFFTEPQEPESQGVRD